MEAQEALAFVEQHQVLLAGGWGIGMDMANWLCGMENLMILMMEQPEFVYGLLEMIYIWNKKPHGGNALGADRSVHTPGVVRRLRFCYTSFLPKRYSAPAEG
jgi:hypothetical protein